MKTNLSGKETDFKSLFSSHFKGYSTSLRLLLKSNFNRLKETDFQQKRKRFYLANVTVQTTQYKIQHTSYALVKKNNMSSRIL